MGEGDLGSASQRWPERFRCALTHIFGTTPIGHKTASWRYDEVTHRMARWWLERSGDPRGPV